MLLCVVISKTTEVFTFRKAEIGTVLKIFHAYARLGVLERVGQRVARSTHFPHALNMQLGSRSFIIAVEGDLRAEGQAAPPANVVNEALLAARLGDRDRRVRQVLDVDDAQTAAALNDGNITYLYLEHDLSAFANRVQRRAVHQLLPGGHDVLDLGGQPHLVGDRAAAGGRVNLVHRAQQVASSEYTRDFSLRAHRQRGRRVLSDKMTDGFIEACVLVDGVLYLPFRGQNVVDSQSWRSRCGQCGGGGDRGPAELRNSNYRRYIAPGQRDKG
jgi:hypothetical protein